MRNRDFFHATIGLVALVVAAFSFGAAYGQVKPDSSQMHYTKQAGTLLNSKSVSANNTILTKTLAGVANRQIHLYSVDVVCSSGSSILTVDDVTTEIYNNAIGTTQTRLVWSTPLTAGLGNNMVIEIAACGVGETGTLIIQADQY